MTVIAGRFQLLEAGSRGAPPRARDLATAQSVWLRQVHLVPEQRAAAVERARAAQGISHPALVTLFDVLPVAEAEVLLAYEFVQAESLARVSGGGPFNARRAAEIVADVSDAVVELHRRGIAHGAIAPATVLLTLKGKAKLDRVGDPSALDQARVPDAASDLAALGELLEALLGPAHQPGVAGRHALEVLIRRARSGGFTSVAQFASLLRRL